MPVIDPIRNKPLKVLQASAGSGKTFSLTAHYLTLLFESGFKYREILAVTFTNKATAEMKSRILEVLRALASGDEKAAIFREIILKAHPNLNPQLLQEKARHAYRQILHDYSRFAITTIDGFVQQVIRSFAFELGLDAGYKLELNTEKVKQDLADRLNIVLDKNPPLLQWITELASDRIRNDKSWNYRNTLLDLAGELFKERYQPFEQALLQHEPGQLFTDLQVLTKNIISYFETSIKELAVKASQIFQQSGVVLDELKGKSRSPLANLEKVVSGDFEKATNLNKLVNNPDEWQKGGLTPAISALYDELNPELAALCNFFIAESPSYQMAKAIEANLFYLRLIQEMGGLLKDYRQENQVLLISDAQNLLRGITQEQGDNPSFIWEKMGNRYRHFLFDEFQDTSAFQWENFLPLLRNNIAEANGKLIDNLVVGDVKQSIYRWRNGDWRILLQQARADVGIDNVVDDSLAENYRSAANVIDFNNFLFTEAPSILQAHINSQVISEGGEEFFNSWWHSHGYNDIIKQAYAHSFQQKATATPPGGQIDIRFLPVENNHARPSKVKQAALHQLAETLDNWIGTAKYHPGQVSILVRSNGEARDVIRHLMHDQQQRSNIARQSGNNHQSYDILSGEALLVANNSAVKLLINTLYMMVTNRDDAGLFKAVCIQLYHQLTGRTAPAEVFLKLNTTAISGLTGYLPMPLCENFMAWQQLPLSELAEKLIGAYGLDQLPDHLAYLLAFRDMISRFNLQGERGITRFLEWWDDEGQSTALPSSEHAAAVQVITIHKSKGLAFDVVMIPFCSWGLDGMTNSIFWVKTAGTPYGMLDSVPVNYTKKLGKSAFAQAYFEELLFNYMDALNMLYVAATRTRTHLYITCPGFAKTDEKIDFAGDLIYQALKKPVPGLQAEFDGEQFVVKDENSVKSIPAIENNPLVFQTYPLSDRLNKALTNKKVWEQLDLLSGNPAQRRGIIMHDLLSRTSNPSDLKNVIGQMQQEGLLRAAGVEGIYDLAISVLNHPELKTLLNNPSENFHEQTIINNKGESYRPDKVLIGENDVVLIDFKFTGESKEEHREQVNEYRGLLTGMGYKNISAWLYYGYSQELISV